MLLIKFIAIAVLVVLFFLFRKWFLKHNYILLLFIPIIILIIYLDYFVSIGNSNNQNDKAELKKWKQEHQNNFVKTDKNNLNDASISKSKIGDIIYDTTFNVNSVKINYKEILVALPENEFSYDSTIVILSITDEKNVLLQTIKQDIYAISSPLNDEDWYNVLADEGIFLDYNFDGYLDIVLRVGNAPNNHAVNGYFNIFVFNPTGKIFEKYTEELVNPSPDPITKRVVCWNIYSTLIEHYIDEFYEWNKGELELKETVESLFLDDQSNDTIAKFREVKSIYQNGIKIKSTEKIIEAIN